MTYLGTRPILPDELEQYELMKALYSACQSADKKTSFSHKLVMTMLPDDYKISRLITRKTGNRTAVIRIAAKESETDRDRILSASFHGKTKKWDAEVTGEDGWEEKIHFMRILCRESNY